MRHTRMALCLLLGLAACGDTQEKVSEEPGEATPAGTPTIYAKIDADGTLNLSKLDEPEALAATGSLGGDDPIAADDAIQLVLAAAREEVKAPHVKLDEHGASNATLALTVDGTTRWKYVQWALQIMASPQVRIRHIDLSDPRGGDALRIDLPVDRGVRETLVEHLEEQKLSEDDLREKNESPRAERAVIKVKVFRRNLMESASEQYTLMKVDNTHAYNLPKGPDANQDDEYWAQMRKLRDTVTSKIAQVDASMFTLELVAPPPKGGSVPYFDVFRILRMARDLGMGDIFLEGKATPLTSRERKALGR